MSTEFPTKNAVPRQWHVIDAEGAVVGKVASKAAMLLMGKHKPIYTPFIDTGDHVIVINAEKARLSRGKKRRKYIATSPGIPADWSRRASSGSKKSGPPASLKTPSRGCSPRRKWANRCTGN